MQEMIYESKFVRVAAFSSGFLIWDNPRKGQNLQWKIEILLSGSETEKGTILKSKREAYTKKKSIKCGTIFGWNGAHKSGLSPAKITHKKYQLLAALDSLFNF